MKQLSYIHGSKYSPDKWFDGKLNIHKVIAETTTTREYRKSGKPIYTHSEILLEPHECKMIVDNWKRVKFPHDWTGVEIFNLGCKLEIGRPSEDNCGLCFSSTMQEGGGGVRAKNIYRSHPERWREGKGYDIPADALIWSFNRMVDKIGRPYDKAGAVLVGKHGNFTGWAVRHILPLFMKQDPDSLFCSEFCAEEWDNLSMDIQGCHNQSLKPPRFWKISPMDLALMDGELL